jgi:hypothetical protein
MWYPELTADRIRCFILLASVAYQDNGRKCVSLEGEYLEKK